MSHHAYIGDCTLLLPALLIILRNISSWCMTHKWSIPMVLCLLIPLSNVGILFGFGLVGGDIFKATRLVIIVILLLFGWSVYAEQRNEQAMVQENI